jgi:uncharacterized protein with beta-barrel porin domain
MNYSSLTSVSTLKGQMKSFNGGIRKLLGGFSIFASLLFAGSATANPVTTVTIGGQNYSVTYTNPITYNDNIPLFSTGSMPWWGSQLLAEQFSTAVGVTLGLPNSGAFGPLFAYEPNLDPPGVDIVATNGVIDRTGTAPGFIPYAYAILETSFPSFSSTSLQPYADMQSIGLDALKNQRELVLNQAGDCDQKGWVVYDSNKTKATSKTKKNQSLCVFAEGGYATGKINGTDTLAGYSTGNASSVYGVEWKPSKQWAVGASYGYGTTSLSNFNFQDTTSSISSNINSGNIYGVYRPDKNWKIAALFGYSDFSYSGSRTYLGDTANAKYSASGYTAALQASYDIPLSRDYNNKKNPLSPVRLKPLVGLAWGANQQGSFSESGSGTLVNVQGQTTNSLMGTVGVRLEAPILLNSKKSMVLTPRVGAAYQYDFLANQAGNKSITANLQSDTSTSYTEAGQNRGSNNAYLDLGADFQLNPQVALFASVNYQVFTNGDQFGYQGGVRVKF